MNSLEVFFSVFRRNTSLIVFTSDLPYESTPMHALVEALASVHGLDETNGVHEMSGQQLAAAFPAMHFSPTEEKLGVFVDESSRAAKEILAAKALLALWKMLDASHLVDSVDAAAVEEVVSFVGASDNTESPEGGAKIVRVSLKGTVKPRFTYSPLYIFLIYVL
jgi:hypothetical protein